MRLKKSAFSLVELSIILVILGLLAGGVLGGKSLIRASELRSVITEYNQYFIAVKTFRDKYFALPGDMNNATQFWGVADADPATCANTASTDKRTCNGDGNGKIDVQSTSTQSFEITRSWQHLANAGLISGSYLGNADQCSGLPDLCPVPKIGDFWHLFYVDIISLGTGFDGEYGNTMIVGTGSSGKLLPEEAWNIDTKMDDGKPAVGKVAVVSTPLSDCTNTALSSNLAATYLLTSSNKVCGIFFRRQF